MNCEHESVKELRDSEEGQRWKYEFPVLAAYCPGCGWMIRVRDLKPMSKYRAAEVQKSEASLEQILRDEVLALTVIAYCFIASTPSFEGDTLTKIGGKLMRRIKEYASIQQEEV